MIRHLLIILSLLIPINISAQELSVEQANTEQPAAAHDDLSYFVDDLNEDCKKCVDSPKGRQCTYCDGVLTGASTVLGMLEYNKTFCPPEDMDTVMVRNSFRRWVLDNDKKDPAIMQMYAVPGLVRAMQESFPCNTTTGVVQ